MKKKTGLVHLYYGDGKGKTTTGMGLCARAAGFGYKVLIYQFMKDNKTCEREVLTLSENITLVAGLDKEKFSYALSEKERQERLDFYLSQFKKVTEMAEEGCDVLFLDEIIYTIQVGLLQEEVLLEYLENKPEHLEIILTGNGPSENLIVAADYVSEIKKIKHPYDKGQPARKGIEF